MALRLPTTQEIYDRNVAYFESALNQTIPETDKAFLRVLAGMEAMNYVELSRLVVERARQNLALTAGADMLAVIGAEYGVTRKAAVAAQLLIEATADTETNVPISASFTGDPHSEKYRPNAGASETSGVIELTVTAEVAGLSGNLLEDDTLTMDDPITGVGNTWTVLSVVEEGSDIEPLEEYRRRVLVAIRTVGGGGNSADYREWAEAVTGCYRAFPYSGAPVGTSYPGDRTVYVEAEATIDEDGIAPAELLDDVRAAINTDPATGIARPCLGDTDENLYVESITRTEFNVEIRDLVVDADIEDAVMIDIGDAVDAYLRGIAPFISGLDPALTQNDMITDLTLSQVIQDVLTPVGGSAAGIGLYLVANTFLPSYVLGQGELAKLGVVTYV
jgi:uncharacterized phage protein gp47/JayE